MGKTDETRALDLLARARAYQLRVVARRKRKSDCRRVRLALSVDRYWHGRAAALRRQSATTASPRCYSGSGLHCEHR